MESLTPRFDPDALADLRFRLHRTRWPDLSDADWESGFDREFLKELCLYWRDGFDWQSQLERLAGVPQYKLQTSVCKIHFLHIKGQGPRAIPIILTHGWPGSSLEMIELIPLLTHPVEHGLAVQTSFDVVVPSLPGFGFSDRLQEPGVNAYRIAEIWVQLMQALGYRRFAAQGGDIGAGVSTELGLRHSDRLLGIHLTLSRGHIVPTWHSGPNCRTTNSSSFQTPERGMDDADYLFILRIYREGRRTPLHLAPNQRVAVPCAIAVFPKEIVMPPRSWVERGYKVSRWTKMPRGGHFAAEEDPRSLASDLHAFFRELG